MQLSTRKLILFFALLLWICLRIVERIQVHERNMNIFSQFSFQDISLVNLPPSMKKTRQMQEYVQLHTASLEMAWGGTMQVKKGAPFLVWSNKYVRSGGIGDRVRGILGAFLLAMITNRTFLIEYVFPTNINQVLVPAGPILWNVSFNEDEIGNVVVIDEAHEANQNPTLFSIDSMHNSTGLRVVTNNWFNFSSLAYIKDLFSPYGDAFTLQAQHDLFYCLFQFTPDVIQKSQQLFSVPSSQKEYIAAHVRTGDTTFISEFWRGSRKKHIGKHPRHNGAEIYQRFHRCVNKIQVGMKHMGINEYPFVYVASDDHATKQKIQALDNRSIFFANNMTLMHVDREDQKNFDSNKESGHLDAWAELLVLINASCFVGSRSGYSDLAIILSNRQPPVERCAIKFWECHDDRINAALLNLAKHAL